MKPLREAHLLEVAVQQPARIEGVRDEAQLEPALAQRLQQRVGGGGEATGRVPRDVLRLEEAPQLVVVKRDAEVGEELADQPRVFDLLDLAGLPEERLVV